MNFKYYLNERTLIGKSESCYLCLKHLLLTASVSSLSFHRYLKDERAVPGNIQKNYTFCLQKNLMKYCAGILFDTKELETILERDRVKVRGEGKRDVLGMFPELER